MAQAAQLSHIRLESAPGPHEHASGIAYGIVAPLDSKGMIDVDAWKRERLLCFVHRIEGGESVRTGLLVHRPGGANGATWAFDYEAGVGEEETGFRFDAHAFSPGAYVSVRDADGATHTYRVAAVKPA
jgi:hypothetical protein